MFARLLKKPNVVLVDVPEHCPEHCSGSQRLLPTLASPERSRSNQVYIEASRSPQASHIPTGKALKRLSSSDRLDGSSLAQLPDLTGRSMYVTDNRALRSSTPLCLTPSQPLSYESEVAKHALSERAIRARSRVLQGTINRRRLDEAFFLWTGVASQKYLMDGRFEQLKQIMCSLQAHELKDVWTEWKTTTRQRRAVQKTLSRFLDWAAIHSFAIAFVRWQVLWAGCSDCRPVKQLRMRREDYDRPRMSLDQIRRWLATDRGRTWLTGSSEAEEPEQFHNMCSSSMIDIESFAQITVDELVSEDGPNLPLPKAQQMYIRTKTLVTPDYSRVKKVLFANDRTRFALSSYLHMVDLIRQQVVQGIHPLGKSKKQLMLEGKRELEEGEIVDEDNEDLGDARVDWRHIAIDLRVPPEGRALQKHIAPAQSDFQALDWCRGYVVDFPDRVVGTLFLKSVLVDLVLWEESVAYCVLLAKDGTVLKKTKFVKGMSHKLRRYDINVELEVECGVAVMVHVAARLQASGYSTVKDHVIVRKLNPLITIRPVQCSKKYNLVESNVHLQMFIVVDRRKGQEELEEDGEAVVEQDYVRDQVFSDSEPEEDEEEEGDGDESQAGPEGGEEEKDPFPHKRRVMFKGREGVVELQRDIKFQAERGVLSAADGPASPLSKVAQYGGVRQQGRDMTTEAPAQFASAFNPRHSEFWIMEAFPSTFVNCLDHDGRRLRRIDLGCCPNCMHIDAQGRVYGCDFRQTFYKMMHERAYEPTLRKEVDRIYRLWYVNDTTGAEDRARRMSTANGIAVHPKRPKVCFVAYSRGPIVMLNSETGQRIGQITPEPPLLGVSTLVVAADVLVLGDSHLIKVLTTTGSCIAVLGECYNEPCLMWTGLELYAADKSSTVWQCYGPKAAAETERRQQKQRALRCRKHWTQTQRLRACTPNTKVRVKTIQREYSAAMDLEGRPLSRALGQSQVLAHHQGLMYYDDQEGRYRPGRFWTEDDSDIRESISELKEMHPDLPVDPGSLHRPA